MLALRPSTSHRSHRRHLPRRLALSTATALAVVTSPTLAQLQFDEFAVHRLPVDSDQTEAASLGDVDGDGDLDLVLGNVGQNRLYLNDGTGIYTDVTAARMPVDSDSTSAAALCDVDGDGDLDLVLGNVGQNRLYLNDGTGTYTDVTATRMPVYIDLTSAAALGDVDGDGDLDIVFGNAGEPPGSPAPNRLYLNDGTGTFTDVTATRMPADSDRTYAAALGDFDSDGDLDIVFGNRGLNRLYVNDGAGSYTDVTATRMPVIIDYWTGTVALGDVDGDGDLDIVCGNISYWDWGSWSCEPCENRIYLNDGTGTFTAAHAWWNEESTAAAALGDVDGDGDLDIVFGNGGYCGQRQNQLYLNDGTGTYTDATSARMPIDSALTSGVALGDLDGDGDLDIICGNSAQQSRLYLNLLRQIDAPAPPRVGSTYTIDIYARYCPTAAATMALPFISGATASIRLPPVGTVGIDPALTIALDPVLIPQPAGVASITVPVPSNSALVNVPIYSQAVIVPYPFQAHLTNVMPDVVRQ